MSDMNDSHSAAHSAAGYLYQARLALLEALRYAYRESDVEIALEKLDDVSFEKDGDALELLQAKHHLKKSGSLTDSSVDLWKTLGVWAKAVKADPSLPGRTRFALITTAHAPTGSAASHLRPVDAGSRNASKAESMLVQAADSTKNTALFQSIAAFRALSPEMRKALVEVIEIIDGAPLIADMESLIEKRLRMIAPRGKASIAREQLEGWWWPRICTALQTSGPGTISIFEVEQKLDDIRDTLKRDALPFDMEGFDPTHEELEKLDDMLFVRQLNAIALGATRLQYAKRDFYRASTQRCQWARQKLLFDGEVGRFDRTLVEEWEPRFEQMCEGLGKGCDKEAVRQAGHQLYGWVETQARFPLRTTVSRFMNVGSYHILADELRVGWHKDYETAYEDSEEGDSDGG